MTTEGPVQESGATPDQRKELYLALLQALLSGKELPPEAVSALVYGMLQDPEVDVGVDVNVVLAQLDEMESRTPGSTQLKEFEAQYRGSDIAIPEEERTTNLLGMELPINFQTLQDTLVTLGLGTGAGLVRAGTSGAKAAGTLSLGGRFLEMGAGQAALTSMASSSRNAMLKSLGAVLNKKGIITLGTLGGVVGGVSWAAGAQADEAKRNAPPGQQGLSIDERDERYARNLVILDTVTGQQIPIEDAIDTTLGGTLGGSTAATGPGSVQGGGGSFSPDLLEMAGAYGIDPNMLAQITQQYAPKVKEFQPPVPTSQGTLYSPDVDLAPRGVDVFGRPRSEVTSEFGARGETVPAGGEVLDRAFTQVKGGQTLLYATTYASELYGVPASLLYGIIAHESGYNPSAEGDQGQSWGLAQIYLPAHLEVTRAQALDPIFAIHWAARNLASNFRKFGSWEAAAMAHNNPEAAGLFSKGIAPDNRFMKYVGTVLDNANASGIGNQIWTGDLLAAAEPGRSAEDMAAERTAISNLGGQVEDMYRLWIGPGDVPKDFSQNWANWIFNNVKSDEELEDTLEQMSTARWPTKPPKLNWFDWASPYRSRIGSILELPDVDYEDPLLTRILNNSTTEGIDVDQTVRQDSRYKKTETYRNDLFTNATKLSQMFGFVG